MSHTAHQINSSEKSSYWVLIGIGIIFFLFSLPVLFSIPKELSAQNYGALVALLFPLTAFGILLGGWKMRQKFLFFGPTPLTPSPTIGQVGGQIGGHVNLASAWEKRDLSITLSCIHTYTSGSGKDSSTHRKVLWQRHDKPVDLPDGDGSKLEFCFDVPAKERTQQTHKGRGTISWEVNIEGMINATQFNRSWKIPVEVGTKQSSIVIPNAHKQATHTAKRKQAEASIEQQINTQTTATGLDIISEQGRNKSMSLFSIIFGLVFAIVGCFLFYRAAQGIAMLWIMAPIFFGVGFGMFCFGLFLLGRKLECRIIGDSVHTRRSLFGRKLYTHQSKLTSPSQLILKSTMSSTSNGKLTEYMAIYARIDINSPNGLVKKNIKLVEGIEGRDAGEAMQRKLINALLNSNNTAHDTLNGELEAL